MKSSSSLFPVALMRAEVLSSKYIEDTYLLKPNNSPDLTAQVALSRLGYAEQDKASRGQPVILIHGLFANRSCWLNDKLEGLATYLLENGMDPWLLEFRGHGDSPVNQLYDKNSVEVYAQFDLPAVQQFIEEQTNQNAIWLGHGVGGVAIATSIAEKALDVSLISGVALFNTQVSSYPLSYYLPVVKLIKRIKQSFKTLNIDPQKGPEAEPKSIMLERFRWSGLFTRWKSKKGKTYWKALESVKLPVLAVTGKKDSENPARTCFKLAKAMSESPTLIQLGKSAGYKKDYKYLDSISGKHASEEVWPEITKWISTLQNSRGL